MNKKHLIIVGASSIALLFASGNPTPVTAAEGTASTCVMCHSGDRSFAGQEPKALATRIKLVIGGEIAHPPLSLSDDSDEAIAKLANTLTSN